MSNTSELQFIETDAGQIYDFIMYVLENGVTEELYPGDERRIFGETLVPLVVALYSTMNDSAKQSTLRYARGEVLDASGRICRSVQDRSATSDNNGSLFSQRSSNSKHHYHQRNPRNLGLLSLFQNHRDHSPAGWLPICRRRSRKRGRRHSIQRDTGRRDQCAG